MVVLECEGSFPRGFTKKEAEKLMNLAARRAGFRSKAVASLAIVSDRRMRALNRKYRGKDKTTDVLSFPAAEGAGFSAPGIERSLGDIFISLAKVRAQAAAAERTVAQEFALMVVHGTLHLLGYDHETLAEERVMFGLQHAILIEAGYF